MSAHKHTRQTFTTDGHSLVSSDAAGRKRRAAVCDSPDLAEELARTLNSAPELLEALRGLLDVLVGGASADTVLYRDSSGGLYVSYVEDYDHTELVGGALEAADTAIARAEGREVKP